MQKFQRLHLKAHQKSKTVQSKVPKKLKEGGGSYHIALHNALGNPDKKR